MSTTAKRQQSLKVSIGQYSEAGRKAENQDFHGAMIPTSSARNLKGIACAIADGISSSPISAQASHTAVTTFLEDYYATSDSWTVHTAATKVITSINSWLHSHNSRATPLDKDRGQVCTFSGLVLKGCTAHVFHVGDSCVMHLSSSHLEKVTKEHRYAVSAEESYLSRALGVDTDVDIDCHEISLQVGDIFLLMTDGAHGFLSFEEIQQLTLPIQQPETGDSLDNCAKAIARAAYDAQSDDNISVQVLRIDGLPERNSAEFLQEAVIKPLGTMNIGDEIDDFRILRSLYDSARSHLYLAESPEGQRVVIKAPGTETVDQEAQLQRFILEEWFLRRISNKHVLSTIEHNHRKSALYVVTEYFPGKTLRQWMTDNAEVSLEQLRDIMEQIIAGLRAFHRLEMIHQDLRPENIMINDEGVVKIIDFGSVSAPGLEEGEIDGAGVLPGTFQYTAPEYLSGDVVSWRSDQYSLGVIAYELLTRRLPYGAAVAQIKSRRDQSRLNYQSARAESTRGRSTDIPLWVDNALRRAVHPDPLKRYEALSEFLSDLRKPNQAWSSQRHVPLIERHPVQFWKTASGLLFLAVIALLIDKLS